MGDLDPGVWTPERIGAAVAAVLSAGAILVRRLSEVARGPHRDVPDPPPCLSLDDALDELHQGIEALQRGVRDVQTALDAAEGRNRGRHDLVLAQLAEARRDIERTTRELGRLGGG